MHGSDVQKFALYFIALRPMHLLYRVLSEALRGKAVLWVLFFVCVFVWLVFWFLIFPSSRSVLLSLTCDFFLHLQASQVVLCSILKPLYDSLAVITPYSAFELPSQATQNIPSHASYHTELNMSSSTGSWCVNFPWETWISVTLILDNRPSPPSSKQLRPVLKSWWVYWTSLQQQSMGERLHDGSIGDSEAVVCQESHFT